MSEEKALTVQSLGEAVKDRVRKAMMDAIPDEALVGLIQTEFKSFFADQTDNYNRQTIPSAFKKLVQSEINLQVNQLVKYKIADLLKDHTQQWSESAGSVVLGPLVAELAPAALTSVMSNIVGVALNALRQNRGF